jgi:hypothetical protein
MIEENMAKDLAKVITGWKVLKRDAHTGNFQVKI